MTLDTILCPAVSVGLVALVWSACRSLGRDTAGHDGAFWSAVGGIVVGCIVAELMGWQIESPAIALSLVSVLAWSAGRSLRDKAAQQKEQETRRPA